MWNNAIKLQDTLDMVYTNEEQLNWLKEHPYCHPISFEREIGGTVYTVNAHFSGKTAETVEGKGNRILSRNFAR